MAAEWKQFHIGVSLFLGKDMIVEGVTSRNFFFSTRPSSPPANLKCQINTEFSLTFTWEEPVRKPDILEYFYIYELETDDQNYICKWYTCIWGRIIFTHLAQ